MFDFAASYQFRIQIAKYMLMINRHSHMLPDGKIHVKGDVTSPQFQ